MNSQNQLVKLEDFDPAFLLKSSNQNGPFIITGPQTQNRILFRKCGNWSIKQNTQYALFINKYYEELQGKSHQILWDQYKKMAKFIGTRNFRQCKSHHQQLLLTFGTLPNILSTLKTNKYFQTILNQQPKNQQRITHNPPQLQPNKQLSPIFQNPTTIHTITECLTKTSDEYQPEIPLGTSKTSLEGKSFQKYPINLNKKQQWLECHKLFIQWTNKLKQLMLTQF